MLLNILPNKTASAANKTLNEMYPILSQAVETEEVAQPYFEYLQAMDKAGAVNATENVNVPLDKAKTSPSGNYYKEIKDIAKIEDKENKVPGKAFDWTSEDLETVEWEFEVSQAGYYNITIDYLAIPGTVLSPRRNITIDGETLFKDLNNIELQRRWKDDGEPWVNPAGDEVRPKQVEIVTWQKFSVWDPDSKYDEPLKIYLKPGKHKIQMELVYEPIVIRSIQFTAPKTIPTYAEVLKGYQDKGYKKANQEIKINAEEPAYKSDSTLRLEFSSDPKADPPSSGSRVLNVIGGANWKSANQAITWSFDVKEAGLYKIDLRMVQNFSGGLPIYRQIMIDGEVPFKEFLNYKIDYDNNWTLKSVADEKDEPYMVYLEAKTHTITLKVNASTYTALLNELEKTLTLLSQCTQKIMTITGASPDTNFDYKLDQKIPNLMTWLKSISDSLQKQIDTLEGMAKKSPTAVNQLSEIKYSVDRMIDDPYRIAAGLETLTNSQNTLSTWLNDFSSSPLQLDYILINNPDGEVKDYRSNFFQKLWASLRTFGISFFKDYDAVTGYTGLTEDTTDYKKIKVWISRGKEWGETLKQLTDETFTRQYKTVADINILPPGQLGAGGVLMMALASNTAPDIAMGVDSLLPSEYGMRNAAIDLKQFDTYDEVVKRFVPGVLNPYNFQGKAFGLPETIDFSIMFYRKDIMSSLGLAIPETWDDVTRKVIPVLKKNGMDFWYEGGLNLFLFQNGGELYKENGTKSGLDSPEAFAAFKQFTDMYGVYEVPVTADFYTRFRSGQMPIGMSSFNTYLKFNSAAPELQGKWGVAVVPGTKRADGTISRANSGVSQGVVMFSSAKDREAAWDFIDWYTSTDTQTRYANDLQAYIGSEARWCSANQAAFDNLPWEKDLKSVIQEQRKFYKDPYNVVGGYITARHVENARVRVVVQKKNYRAALEKSIKDINRELADKQAEFAKRAALGK